jgi:hypothetical protein
VPTKDIDLSAQAGPGHRPQLKIFRRISTRLLRTRGQPHRDPGRMTKKGYGIGPLGFKCQD